MTKKHSTTGCNGHFKVEVVEGGDHLTFHVENRDASREYRFVIGFNEFDEDDNDDYSRSPLMDLPAGGKVTENFNPDGVRDIIVSFYHEPDDTHIWFVRNPDGQFVQHKEC
jgi:hypothetical protein